MHLSSLMVEYPLSPLCVDYISYWMKKKERIKSCYCFTNRAKDMHLVISSKMNQFEPWIISQNTYLDLMSSIKISYGVSSNSDGEEVKFIFFSLTPRRSSSTTCIQNRACKLRKERKKEIQYYYTCFQKLSLWYRIYGHSCSFIFFLNT